jgi:hypothetical protein
MVETDRCDLHEAAVFGGAEATDAMISLARSPIGDECQICPVCRTARKYVECRLAEKAGRVFPREGNSEAAWRELQAAIERAKLTVHRST